MVRYGEGISDCFIHVGTPIAVLVIQFSCLHNCNSWCRCLFHQNIHCSSIGSNGASVIENSIHKLIVSGKIGTGCIGKRSIGIYHQGTVGRSTHWTYSNVYRLRIAFGIVVIVENIATNNNIYFSIIGIIVSYCNIANVRYDINDYRSCIAQCRVPIITDSILESILSLETRIRGVGITTVWIHRNRSV